MHAVTHLPSATETDGGAEQQNVEPVRKSALRHPTRLEVRRLGRQAIKRANSPLRPSGRLSRRRSGPTPVTQAAVRADWSRAESSAKRIVHSTTRRRLSS